MIISQGYSKSNLEASLKHTCLRLCGSFSLGMLLCGLAWAAQRNLCYRLVNGPEIGMMLPCDADRFTGKRVIPGMQLLGNIVGTSGRIRVFFRFIRKKMFSHTYTYTYSISIYLYILYSSMILLMLLLLLSILLYLTFSLLHHHQENMFV